MLMELTTYSIFWSSIAPCWQCGSIQKQCGYRLRLSHLIIYCTGDAIIAHRIITLLNDIKLILVSSTNENQDFSILEWFQTPPYPMICYTYH